MGPRPAASGWCGVGLLGEDAGALGRRAGGAPARRRRPARRGPTGRTAAWRTRAPGPRTGDPTRSAQYGSSSMRGSRGFDPVTIEQVGRVVPELRQRRVSGRRCGPPPAHPAAPRPRCRGAPRPSASPEAASSRPRNCRSVCVERAVGHVVDQAHRSIARRRVCRRPLRLPAEPSLPAGPRRPNQPHHRQLPHIGVGDGDLLAAGAGRPPAARRSPPPIRPRP